MGATSNGGPLTRAAQARSGILERRQFRQEVLALAAAGMSHEAIADAVTKKRQADHDKMLMDVPEQLHDQVPPPRKITTGRVTSTLNSIFEEWEKQGRDDVPKAMALELERLDQMLKAMWPVALGRPRFEGDKTPTIGQQSRAVESVLKIQERRSKYLGLDQPEKVEHAHVFGTAQDMEEVSRMKELWLKTGGIEGSVVEHEPQLEPAVTPS